MARYGCAMNEALMDPQHTMRAGDALRQELARGDMALAGVAPVLSHLLSSPGQALVSEDVLARMRGMLGDLARQLLVAYAYDDGSLRFRFRRAGDYESGERYGQGA